MSITEPVLGGVTQQIGRNAPPLLSYGKPLSPLPSTGGLLGTLGLITATVSAIGYLGGNKFRDDQLAKSGLTYDETTGLSRPINTAGAGKVTQGIPPFTGGQSAGISYRVILDVRMQSNPSQRLVYSTANGGSGIFIAVGDNPPVNQWGNFGIAGAIQGASFDNFGTNYRFFVNGIHVASRNNTQGVVVSVAIAGVVRMDGQTDTGGNPAGVGGGTPLLEGYSGNQTDNSRREAPKILPPSFSPALGWGNGKPLTTGVRAAVGLGTDVNTGTSTRTPDRRIAPNPNPSSTPKPITSPPEIPKKKDEPKAPFSPVIPVDVTTQLASIGSILGVMSNNVADIKANTSPDALKNAAKAGSCETMKSPSCTKDMEDRIKDPVNANVDAKTGALNTALSGTNTLLSGFVAASTSSFQKILSVLNNSVVDRTLAVMNLATNIHNAALLTRDIGETLGSVVDNVISLTPLRFTNSEGSQVQFTDFVGSNFRAFVISILGAERYVELTLNWQKASMILNSAAQVLNTTQSMLDPISSAVEYGMENVSKIGNSLKEDGVVSENAYSAMDETIRARRVNRFERLNDTLEGAENIASNLSSVTSSAVSIKEDYKQLREDSKDLRDKATAFNATDATARAQLKASLPTNVTAITLAPAPAEDEEP